MLNKTYRKNILREMNSSKSRFLSFFGIIMLGVMMLTGLMSVAPDMRAAGQTYFRQQNLFDLRVISTLGLSGEDVQAIAATEGVQAVMAVQAVDCEAHWQGQEDTQVVRVQQLPADPQSDAAENMNRLVLKEGRLPEKPGECAIHIMGVAGQNRLGNTLVLAEGTDAVAEQTLTVVGVVQDPMHFSIDAESSTAGDGSLNALVFVADGSFTTDYYTYCYIKVEGADVFDNYSEEYDAVVEPVASRLEAISWERSEQRRVQLIDSANTQLADARAELAEKKAEAEEQFAQAEAQIAQAEQQLRDALAQLQTGEAEYAAGQAQLQQQKTALPGTMQGGAEEILSGQAQMLEFESQLQQIKLLVNLKQVADPLLGYAEVALDNAQRALDEAEPEDEDYVELRDLLARAQSLYDSIYAQLEGYQAQLDEGKRQMYAQGLLSSPELSNADMVREAETALRQMKLALVEGQLALTTGTVTAWTAFDQAEQQLASARARLNAGWTEYNEGLDALNVAKREFAAQKADAQAQLADAQQQLNDAEEQVDEIAAGEWYVLDRDTVTSLVTFEQNADRIQSIARVFPVFFFLVAALVATTTMTRMVDEDRLQMGALKALGYSSGAIAAKYLFYGLTASLLGSAAGMLVGFLGFPAVIWYAYSIMYQLPTFRLIFYPGLIAASLLISAAIVGLTTLAACQACLKEKSAALLLPRAPAAGKRILLEHIRPLWKRMSFSQKTTARNMFRYKKRFFMTVLGVAGCTALLLVGFGIQDSIMDIIDKQNSELNHSDLSVSLSSEKALTTDPGLTGMLDGEESVASWGVFYTRTVSVYNADGQEGSVTAITAREPERLTEYFTLRTRRGHEEIPFEENSVILTEKTAETLGLSVGDSLWVQSPDGARVELTLTGVTENYLFTRLFLSQDQMERVLGAQPEWNTVCARISGAAEADREALSTRLLECNYVSSVSFAEDTTQIFDNTISCINYVVLLVIVCAAALAAVVLYNLINVNLAERKKELATIKVLGFYDKEVYRYIFREIELLSLIGAAVGLCIGVPLHQFIIRTVEMDQMMFIRSIAPSSYLYSVVLTMVFTLVMCFVMRPHVKRISMVESMKAPE